jgi:hypothetical protein
LTTVLAAAGSSIRKSKALPVPRRNKDFKEQYEVLKKKRMIRVQLYGSTSNNPNWTRAFGFVLPCCCDDGEYHLTLPESEERCVCVKRDYLRVVNYT